MEAGGWLGVVSFVCSYWCLLSRFCEFLLFRERTVDIDGGAMIGFLPALGNGLGKKNGGVLKSSRCERTVVMSARMMPEPLEPEKPPTPPPGREEPGPPKAFPTPMVAVGEGQMDIYSRLAKDRILVLGRAVDDEVGRG